ncbi:MAG: hypothetical protein WCX85_03800 [Bacilli bacterium]|jgi:hypothetical protein|nr:hypothetical protein [Bacilli bacterium]
MHKEKISSNSKTVAIRKRGMVCFLLYVSALLALAFVGLSFLDSYAVASEMVEDTYYSGIEIALGVSDLTLNYLLLSCLVVGTIGGLLTLVVAIICSIIKKYSPIASMLMALAIASLSYAFVVSLLFPVVISNSLSELANPLELIKTMWPIYTMTALLGSSMLINLALLIFASVDAYATSGLNKSK